MLWVPARARITNKSAGSAVYLLDGSSANVLRITIGSRSVAVGFAARGTINLRAGASAGGGRTGTTYKAGNAEVEDVNIENGID